MCGHTLFWRNYVESLCPVHLLLGLHAGPSQLFIIFSSEDISKWDQILSAAQYQVLGAGNDVWKATFGAFYALLQVRCKAALLALPM